MNNIAPASTPYSRPPVKNESATAIKLALSGEEDKWSLESEGYDISLLDCLSKNEERALKKMRRKIKNKVSVINIFVQYFFTPENEKQFSTRQHFKAISNLRISPRSLPRSPAAKRRSMWRGWRGGSTSSPWLTKS